MRHLALVLFCAYLSATILIWNFRYYTGRWMIWFGYLVREWIDPELGHKAFLFLIRWTYWQPAWADPTWIARTIGNARETRE